jgi:hypothetical protein
MRRPDMTYLIQIILGVIIGGAGFHQIAENPIQGISALFLAGFLVMTGFEKRLSRQNEKPEVESN